MYVHMYVFSTICIRLHLFNFHNLFVSHCQYLCVFNPYLSIIVIIPSILEVSHFHYWNSQTQRYLEPAMICIYEFMQGLLNYAYTYRE